MNEEKVKQTLAEKKPIEAPQKKTGKEYIFVKIKRDQPTVFWNAEKERTLIEAEHGVFRTRDKSIAVMLRRLNYLECHDASDIPKPNMLGE